LNPLRHLFVDTRQEVFVNLQAVAELMEAQAEYFKRHTELLQLFNQDKKHVYKTAITNSDAETQACLEQLKSQSLSLRNKLVNFYNYTNLVMENFERRLSGLTAQDQRNFDLLEQEFAEFRKILPSIELSKHYQQWFDFTSEDRVERADKFAKQ